MAYNRIIIQGRLVADPEMKQTTNGVDFCNARVAVDRPSRKGGDKQTDFFNVTAWRASAGFLANYFSKGDGILVEGSMQSREGTDKDGNPRTFWGVEVDNIRFVDGGRKNSDAEPSGGVSSGPSFSVTAPVFSEIADDEDLPF